MTKEKTDVLTDKDFIKINTPKKRYYHTLANDSLAVDENNDAYLETLIGMEYDVESEDELDDIEFDDEEIDK